jgi:hypothetical protein
VGYGRAENGLDFLDSVEEKHTFQKGVEVSAFMEKNNLDY